MFGLTKTDNPLRRILVNFTQTVIFVLQLKGRFAFTYLLYLQTTYVVVKLDAAQLLNYVQEGLQTKEPGNHYLY